jgi:small subunit ribosomal protein S14
MAKKSILEREKKRKYLVTKYNEKRTVIKKSLKSVFSSSERMSLYAKLHSLPRNSFPSRLHNRCWMTGRSHGYYRNFGISRHVLREMAHECLLPGITKSSW